MKKQLQYLKGKNVWEIQVLCLDEEKETIFYNCCVFMAKKCITEILYSAIAEELISPFPFDEITEYAMNSKKYVFWKQNNISLSVSILFPVPMLWTVFSGVQTPSDLAGAPP